MAGDVNIWVDAIDSAGRVTTRKFPVHVDACRLSVDGGPDLEWSPGMKVAIRAPPSVAFAERPSREKSSVMLTGSTEVAERPPTETST